MVQHNRKYYERKEEDPDRVTYLSFSSFQLLLCIQVLGRNKRRQLVTTADDGNERDIAHIPIKSLNEQFFQENSRHMQPITFLPFQSLKVYLDGEFMLANCGCGISNVFERNS